MPRNRLIGVALVAFVATGAALLAAQGQALYTGTPADVIRVRVVNSGHSEIMPVSIQEGTSPLKTEITNKPTVVLDPTAVITARIVSRTWEYKLVAVHPGNAADDARALSAEGAQGWEATGAVLTSPSGPTILMKREK